MNFGVFAHGLSFPYQTLPNTLQIPNSVETEKLLATFQKLRDESHTIQGASDDYKEGREMGIQLCINELIRGEK